MNETGHNSGALTPDEERALFFNHFNKIVRQDGIVRASRKQLGQLRKEAKSDGINPREMDLALRINALEDDAVVVDEFKDMARVMSWMGLPVNFQASMFDDLAPLDERARAAGAFASAAGKPGAPQHAPGSEPYKAWMRGYNDDGAARMKVIDGAMKKSAMIAAKAKAGPGKSEAEKALDGEPDFPDDTPDKPPETEPIQEEKASQRPLKKAAAKVKESA